MIYTAILSHDNGKTRVKMNAENPDKFIDGIMEIEGCPRSAITNIKEA